MTGTTIDIGMLISIIGLNRFDKKIEALINQFGTAPKVTIDKEDDADDEYVEFKSHGMGLYFERNTLKSIFLHSSDNEFDYNQYEGPLPMQISFSQAKSEIIELLGQPDYEGGGNVGHFGPNLPWIKYEMNDYVLHFEFASDSESIRMVTLM